MMGLLNTGITIMNFDETYYTQQMLQRLPHENINVQHMNHVNLYCEDESLTQLEGCFQKRKQKGITFIGNGNYHYVTYLLLKEITSPFTLLLFDHHPDLGMGEEERDHLLSCGSWVSSALRDIPLLQKVIIIGPTESNASYTIKPQIKIFPFDGTTRYSIKSILSIIHTDHVYMSIDKDVLNTHEVQTNWDQGVMSIETLISYLSIILKNKKVEGVDICGELKLSPLQTLLPNYRTKIHKNEKANIKILNACINEVRQSQGA